MQFQSYFLYLSRTIKNAMNIHFNLKDAKAKTSSIRLVVSHRGTVIHKAVGVSVPTARWNKNRERSGIVSIDARLVDIRTYLESHYNELTPLEDLKRGIERALMTEDERKSADAPEKPIRPSFWAYFEEWSNRVSPARRQRRLAYNVILKLMGTDADWEQIDSAFYFTLIGKFNKEKFSKNYQGTLVSKLKTVMSEGAKLKYHTSRDYENFHKSVERVDAVYLTADEIDRLWGLELEDGMQRRTRDLFLLGVYTAARFSDYSRLSMDNVQGDFIRFVQHKTGDSVIVPMSPRVQVILKRNGGHAPSVNQVVFNRTIKEVCRLAGIDTVVEQKHSEGRTHYVTYEPKWKLVSSHTARRTAVTLLHRSGVPSSEIMMISGHKSLSAFEQYIKTTKEDTATSLAQHSFFK